MHPEDASQGLKRVALIGTYSPRQCGIATFTADLSQALQGEFDSTEVLAVAINDTDKLYAYPETVQFQISEKEADAYRRAADFLNVGHVDVVSLQHEYGIFGGKAGSHILLLLRELRMPIITTLHTIVEEPTEQQKSVLEEILQLSERVVVMNHRAKEMLGNIHSVPLEKIDVIHHGIPDTKFTNPEDNKEVLGLSGNKVLTTFGLLSPDKGLEFVIQALPKIVEKHPETIYTIVGATHPNIKQRHGESYRIGLQHLATELGVSGHVVFHNRYTSKEELAKFLAGTDVYLTPYLNMSQISSGTLAYAYGIGTAVVSTPYWCAKELLADGRGVVVPDRDPDAIAEAVIDLLDHDEKRQEMREKAFKAGREMTWPAVGRQYGECFMRAKHDHDTRLPRHFHLKPIGERPMQLPGLSLSHLERMTDDTGLIQHAVFDIPNYNEGYALDDNARALILVSLLDQNGLAPVGLVQELGARYMAFVWHAYNVLTGRFRNFLAYDRHWAEKIGSEDSHGRTIHALGTIINRSTAPTYHAVAQILFEDSITAVAKFGSLRGWAFSLLGIDEYLHRFPDHPHVPKLRVDLIKKTQRAYHKHSAKDWKWFEDALTYDNAKIPHAVIVSAHAAGMPDALEMGLESLQWLIEIQTSDGKFFSPIGSDGYYRQGCERAHFDQQPIEAYSTVSACLAAHKVTGDPKWLLEAKRAFGWFLGHNDLGAIMFEPRTGACRDGIHPDGVNQNMGAESTLAFLISLVEMYAAQEETYQPTSSEQKRAILH